MIEGTTTYPNGFNSGHFPVCFAIKKKSNRLKNSPRSVFCYHKADFDGLRHTLSHILWDSFISCDDIDSSTANFQDLVLAAVNQHVPTARLRRNSRPPWIDNDGLKMVKKKKALWKRLKSNASAVLTSKFKPLRKETKSLISSKYRQYLKSLSEKLKSNPTKFWSFHSLKTKTKRLPEVITYRSKAKSAKDPLEKASLKTTSLDQCSPQKISDLSAVVPHSDVVNPDLLMEVSTSNNMVKDIISMLDIIKATGIDGISARVLKECAEELSYPLTLLFNLSFRSGKFPASWKRAHVTPVHKADAKDVAENYRPISLRPYQVKAKRR